MPWEEQDSRRELPDLKPRGWKYLEDDDLMPFGKHKGVRMKDVPAEYLLWLRGEGCSNKSVANYIARNLDKIERDAKR
ncbi:MAG: DUF3820 family protein [Taibaiella sp.]|nr:DUF3820 family protein [Taibaiella sp.]